jgi:hypothetical protein
MTEVDVEGRLERPASFLSRDSPFLFSWHGYGHGYVMGL